MKKMVRMYFDKGATTSDLDILKMQLAQKVVYKAAQNRMVGANACIMETMSVLDIKMSLPKVKMLLPERIKEGSGARLQKMEWFDVNETMEKEQVRVEFTDEAKIRQLSGLQSKYTLEAASKGLGYSKDTDIFSTIAAASYASDAASGFWTDTSTDKAADIAASIGAMLDTADITENDIPQIGVYYPAKLWPYFATPIQIGEAQQTIRKWVESEFKMQFFGTKQLTNTCQVVLKSAMNLTHVTLENPDIQLVEPVREPGVGDIYLITQYYKTFVLPETEGDTTNKMIRTITGVV
jgi:hypothetical protein